MGGYTLGGGVVIKILKKLVRQKCSSLKIRQKCSSQTSKKTYNNYKTELCNKFFKKNI